MIDKVKLNDDSVEYSINDSYTREDLYTNIDSIIYLSNVKNSIARGKDITEYFTDGSLYTRISSGTFEDLFVGDYFTASYNGTDINFRIAGFNTYYNQGSITLTSNHAVIVPDTKLVKDYMNSSESTDGGYVNSYMNTRIIGSVTTTGSTNNVNGNLYNIFGDHLLTYNEYLSSSVTTTVTNTGYTALSGVAISGTWTNIQAVLLSEMDLYGTLVFSAGWSNIGISNVQLPLFALMPQYRNPHNEILWLRDVASSTDFCYYDSVCRTSYLPANYVASDGTYPSVRPKFLIG